MLHDLVRGHRCGEVQVHRALSFLGAEHVIILSFSLQENVRSPLSIVCLIVVGILVVEVLACTGAISIKHFLFLSTGNEISGIAWNRSALSELPLLLHSILI